MSGTTGCRTVAGASQWPPFTICLSHNTRKRLIRAGRATSSEAVGVMHGWSPAVPLALSPGAQQSPPGPRSYRASRRSPPARHCPCWLARSGWSQRGRSVQQSCQLFLRRRPGQIPHKDTHRSLLQAWSCRPAPAVTYVPRPTRCSSPERSRSRHVSATLLSTPSQVRISAGVRPSGCSWSRATMRRACRHEHPSGRFLTACHRSHITPPTSWQESVAQCLSMCR